MLAAYTTSPEAVFGAAFVSILPSHRLLHGSSPVGPALHKALVHGKSETVNTHIDVHQVITSYNVSMGILERCLINLLNEYRIYDYSQSCR